MQWVHAFWHILTTAISLVIGALVKATFSKSLPKTCLKPRHLAEQFFNSPTWVAQTKSWKVPRTKYYSKVPFTAEVVNRLPNKYHAYGFVTWHHFAKAQTNCRGLLLIELIITLVSNSPAGSSQGPSGSQSYIQVAVYSSIKMMWTMLVSMSYLNLGPQIRISISWIDGRCIYSSPIQELVSKRSLKSLHNISITFVRTEYSHKYNAMSCWVLAYNPIVLHTVYNSIDWIFGHYLFGY